MIIIIMKRWILTDTIQSALTRRHCINNDMPTVHARTRTIENKTGEGTDPRMWEKICAQPQHISFENLLFPSTAVLWNDLSVGTQQKYFSKSKRIQTLFILIRHTLAWILIITWVKETNRSPTADFESRWVTFVTTCLTATYITSSSCVVVWPP